MKARVETLARYNRWANRLLYDAVAKLPDTQYREDRGAFFRSIHGTLNHVLVADRSWVARLVGEAVAANKLNDILFDRFADLRAAREAEDQRIITIAAATPEAKFAEILSYRRVSSPEPVRNAVADIWLHIANHQTHHRAQVHTLLTQLGEPAPELDLIYYVRLNEAGKAD